MRKLALALTAATMLGATVPASAQSFYADVGFGPSYGWGWGGPQAHAGNWAWGGGPYAYSYGPGIGFSAGFPAARTYVYRDRPRYRARRVVRSWGPAYDAYAYDPYYAYGGPAVTVGTPGFGFGVGFGTGWGHRW